MCGLKKPECQSKEQLSVSDQCLRFVCFCVYLPSALLLWNRKKFLPSGGSSRVFSLACQRTLSLWLCPLTKFTSSAVNSAASRTLTARWTWKKWNRAFTGFDIVRLFWPGSKKTQGWPEYLYIKPRQETKQKVNILFMPPLSVCCRWLLYCAYPRFQCNAC